MYWPTLVLWSAISGVIAALIFRRFASAGIRQTVNRIEAHLMELWLFLDEPSLIFRAQRHLLRENLRLLRQIAVPVAITASLFALVMWQADKYYGRGPLPAGEPAVVTAHISSGHLAGVRLEAPSDVAIETPGVRVERLREVSWRIRPRRPFSGDLSLAGGVGQVEIPWPRRSWAPWFVLISLVAALLVPGFRKRQVVMLLLFIWPASAAEKPPVILISIDTMRFDRLSAVPEVVAFGEKGTIFTQIDAQVPLTLPSHASLMTSAYPFENRVELNGDALPARAVTLASILRNNGYRTGAFIGSMVLDRRYGLDQGFDVYDSPFGNSRVRRDAALVVRAALQWLEKKDDRTPFAFLHLYDLHTPYTLPGIAGLTPNAKGYDAELQYVNQVLGRLREAWIRDGLWDKALIILLGDHGESLGDHGETSHGYFVYESTIHVPLVIHWPAGLSKRPDRIAQPGGLIDVAPTILDALGIAPPPSFDGTSLLRGERAVYSESIYPRQAFGWAPLRSLRWRQYKYIEAPKPELYDLEKDAGERSNIISAHPQEAQSMKARMHELMAKYPPKASPGEPQISTRGREVLGSLGYTGGGRQAKSRPIDPKDKLPEAEAYESALALLYSAEYGRAIRAFTRIVTQDARNLPALCALGEAYLRSGNSPRALTLWQQALEQDPGYQPAADSIGEYWLAQKDYGKACRFVPQAPECAAGRYH